MSLPGKYLQWCKYIQIIIVILNFIAFIIICCTIKETSTSSSIVRVVGEKIGIVDYTDCSNAHGLGKCRERIRDEECQCSDVNFNITTDLLVSSEVFIYYELESFNQTEIAKDPNFFKSRDNRQLAGQLSLNVSPDCGEFSISRDNAGKPIAPCGALAHYIFNDTVSIKRIVNGFYEEVPTLDYGIISEADKQGFRNPESDDSADNTDLATVFQNFSSPSTWSKKLWELDVNIRENNGFQNERFIGWMKPEWDMKPLARLDQSKRGYTRGLPNGTYSVQATYNYSPSIYNGTRKVTIAMNGIRVVTTWDTSAPAVRVWLLILILTSLVAMGVAFYFTYAAARCRDSRC